jgi:hypothetical protein
MTVSFVTQNSDDVVFLNSNTGEFRPYAGFKVMYAMIEDQGDCLFQTRKNLKCDYENVDGENRLSWAIENLTAISDESELVCKACFLRAKVLPSQNDARPTMRSPVIDSSRKYLTFWYRLGENSRLLVKLVYQSDFESKRLDSATILMQIEESTGNDWRVASVEMGSGLIDNYRLLFVLEKTVNFSKLKFIAVKQFKT